MAYSFPTNFYDEDEEEMERLKRASQGVLVNASTAQQPQAPAPMAAPATRPRRVEGDPNSYMNVGWGGAQSGAQDGMGGALGGMLREMTKERLMRAGDGDMGKGALTAGKGLGQILGKGAGAIGSGAGALGGAIGSGASAAGSGIAAGIAKLATLLPFI